LLADVTLLAVAEDLVQPASSNVERSVQILRSKRLHGEVLVIGVPSENGR
jgi:hypothetical protein